MFNECLYIENATHKVEVRELTEVMAENLSEMGTVMSLNFMGSKTDVWRNRVRSAEYVSRSTLMELKSRALRRDERNGWIS